MKSSRTPRTERDPLWRREVRERWRRPWTFLLLGVYSATLAILARVFYGALVPQGEVRFSKEGLGLGAPLFWKFVAWQIAGWVPLGLLLGAPAIALERERRSLAEYVLAGIEPRQIVRAKWGSLASFALVLVVAPLPVAALCFPLGGVSPLDFAAANVMCVGVALASCAMGLALSAIHKTVSAAVVSAMGKALSLGLLIGPLFLLVSQVPPQLLLVVGVAGALLPFYLLPRIEEEVSFLSRHLEVDAMRTPDYASSVNQPLRLEPAMMTFAQGSAESREPMSSLELARYLNAAQVERERLDPPPSRLDVALESFAARNVLARRDVRTQLRAWRRALLLGEPAPLFSLRAALSIGIALGVLGLITSGVANVLHSLFDLTILVAMVQVALLAAGGFARERAGNMMVQLQLSALSPSEIVGAKIGAPLLLGARFWGLPMLALGLASLGFGPLRVIVEWLLAGALLVFAALVGTLCSLLFRAISLANCVAIGVLALLFVVLPPLFSPMLFSAPEWLQTWWLAPLRVLLSGGKNTGVLGHLLLPLGILGGALWLMSLRAWERCIQNA